MWHLLTSFGDVVPSEVPLLSLAANDEILSVSSVNSLGRVYYSVFNNKTQTSSIQYLLIDQDAGMGGITLENLSYSPYSLQIDDVNMKMIWTSGITEPVEKVTGTNYYTVIYMSSLFSYSGIVRIVVQLPNLQTQSQQEYIPCSIVVIPKLIPNAFDGTVNLVVISNRSGQQRFHWIR